MSDMNMALARQAAQERQAIDERRTEVLRLQRELAAEAAGASATTPAAARAVPNGVFARVAERLHLSQARPALR